MFGPSFAPEFRAAWMHSYKCSSALLQDVILAISTAIKGARNSTLDMWDRASFAKCTISVRKLRTAQALGIHDALAILALGQTQAAFD